MKNNLLLLFFILFCFSANVQAQYTPSQRVIQLTQSGEKFLLEREYRKALKSYQKALELSPGFSAALRGQGASFELLGMYKEAVLSYDAILEQNPTYSRTMYYDYANVLFKSGNYSKALEYFLEFKRISALSDEEFQYRGGEERSIEANYTKILADNISSCHVAMDSITYQNIKVLNNLGASINTKADEYFPFLSNDQEYLFYTTRKDQFSDENLFLSDKEKGEFVRGESISNEINSAGNEGMSTVVKNGRKIYFTACDRRQVLGTCDIWTAELDEMDLINSEPIKGYANSGHWESQASISCDGTLLYFASNREGGYGGTDIWLSRQLPDGRWGKPENLGPHINTPKDEEAPFITNDGQVLYFSSNGHIGLGEQDIFMSRQNYNNLWSKPINLGVPVNSSYRELGFFLTADGKTGYISSNREEGFGGMDIYHFELPEHLTSYPITYVEGVVRDSVYNLPVRTTLYFDDRLPIKTDERGRFFRCVPAGEAWNFTVTQRDFKKYSKRTIIPRWENKENYKVEVLLQPEDYLLNITEEKRALKLASEEKMQKVYFGVDAYGLEVNHRNQLNKFLDECFSGENTIIQVDIVGFADASGGDAYNMMLSEKRSKSVAIYIQSRGVRVDKIYLGAEGEIQDRSGESWENRRVEVRVKYVKE